VQVRRRTLAALLLFVLFAASPTVAATKTSKPRPKPTRARVTKPAATTARAPAVTAPTTVALSGSITVFAATSLTASFTDIARAFEKAHPGVQVTMNFAGSSTLATQIQNGAPADVFASADTANMDRLVAGKFVRNPVVFTRNRLMIVVPKGNPLRVNTLADLARSEVFVALGAPGVPVGDYARQILARAGVSVTPKTLESNVAAIVNKAALREIDAGVVYATDVAIDDYRVDGVAIPDQQNVIAAYPIAVTTSSKNKAAATAFAAFTQTSAAQAVLATYKFLPLK
jgi:molybdate transport system substrate-binding protein